MRTSEKYTNIANVTVIKDYVLLNVCWKEVILNSKPVTKRNIYYKKHLRVVKVLKKSVRATIITK